MSSFDGLTSAEPGEGGTAINLSTDEKTMSWLTVPGKDNSSELARSIRARVEKKIAAGEFTADEVAYIAKVDLSVVKGDLKVSDENLERLRRLCALWDIDLKVFSISSHRKILGPVIVTFKKILFPILRVFLKECIKQQRAFNAEVISYLACVSREQNEKQESQ